MSSRSLRLRLAVILTLLGAWVMTASIVMATVTTSTYSGVILADSPIAYWRMDEASGNLTDLVASRVLTAVGTPSYAQTGAILPDTDTAILFDGGTDKFTNTTLSPPLAANNRTVEAWCRATNTATKQGCAGWGDSGVVADEYDMGFNTSKVYLQGDSRDTTGVTALSNDTWYHLAGTYDGTNVRLYVNGVLDVTTAQALDTTNTDGVHVGAFTSGYSAYLTGQVDEVAIYSTVLTAAQILSHYNNGVSSIRKVSGSSAIRKIAGLSMNVYKKIGGLA